MLEAQDVDYEYRDYRKQPLEENEIRSLLDRLGVKPREVLRTRDRAYRELGLSGEEPPEELIRHLASHPTLLQRPIGVAGDHAVIGRPPERLLDLVGNRETQNDP